MSSVAPDEMWTLAFGENSFVRILNLYYVMVQSLKGYAPDDSRLVRSHGLAAKLFEHAASAFWLSKGTRVPEMSALEVDFCDHSSIALLARAALECYLVFYYVFLDPKSEDEFEFRYNGWMLAGLARREHYPFQLAEHRIRVDEERPLYESLREAVKQTTTFQRLKGKAQDRLLLKGKRWRLHPWTEIAKRAGFGPQYIDSLYDYLSDYAHCGALATLQVSQAQSREDQLEHAKSSLRTIMIVLCKMMNSYTEKFPEAAEALESDPEASHICEILTEVARRLG